MKIIGALLAALLIGFGIRSIWTRTSPLWFLHLDEYWPGDQSWEAYRWVAVLLGLLHVGAGVWMLVVTFGE
ncbi:hypothetical protein [Cognatilysobacter bugurensis]|uniref:Uncharacterized protein n=1 Tax=Cognatilysobacter bugurensis TaxID=543356 RepID=A0A918SY13_9GAMM|nr:hypothetical protein [Lysobacter bugurensis]GHA77489.1 hypothetical protein GCM10007067_13650 [Lysobacter bugurensis]